MKEFHFMNIFTLLGEAHLTGLKEPEHLNLASVYHENGGIEWLKTYIIQWFLQNRDVVEPFFTIMGEAEFAAWAQSQAESLVPSNFLQVPSPLHNVCAAAKDAVISESQKQAAEAARKKTLQQWFISAAILDATNDLTSFVLDGCLQIYIRKYFND